MYKLLFFWPLCPSLPNIKHIIFRLIKNWLYCFGHITNFFQHRYQLKNINWRLIPVYGTIQIWEWITWMPKYLQLKIILFLPSKVCLNIPQKEEFQCKMVLSRIVEIYFFHFFPSNLHLIFAARFCLVIWFSFLLFGSVILTLNSYRNFLLHQCILIDHWTRRVKIHKTKTHHKTSFIPLSPEPNQPFLASEIF